MNDAAQIILHGSLPDETRQREKAISAYEMADQLTTTRYEFVSGMTRHVLRLEEAANGT